MDNPYQAPHEEGSPPEKVDSLSWTWSILAGVAWSIGASFPITMLMVSFFRFPIPFGGIVSGPQYIPASIFALMMYGIALGGFLVLAFAGGVAGATARAIGSTAASQRLILRILAAGISLVLLMILATLDWVIGPW